MIKVIGTGHTAILVEDVKKAAEFYKNHFGFEIGYVAEDWGIVRKGKNDIAFINKKNSHHPPHFGLRVNSRGEVDEAFEYLKKNNVKILREPKEHRDKSYSLYFEDLDGNVVELIYDPNLQ